MSIGIRDDDVSGPKLREELLHQLEGRVVLDRERGLAEIPVTSSEPHDRSGDEPDPCSS